jgi:hypothetical protein
MSSPKRTRVLIEDSAAIASINHVLSLCGFNEKVTAVEDVNLRNKNI